MENNPTGKTYDGALKLHSALGQIKKISVFRVTRPLI